MFDSDADSSTAVRQLSLSSAEHAAIELQRFKYIRVNRLKLAQYLVAKEEFNFKVFRL